MDLPLYCIIEDWPVKGVETEDGGVDILAYDPKTGEFVRDMSYGSRVLLLEGDASMVSRDEFERCVAELRAERRRGHP